MTYRWPLPHGAERPTQAEGADDEVVTAPDVQALLDGIRLELGKLRASLLPLLRLLPTGELRRLRDQAEQRDRLPLHEASTDRMIDAQISAVLVRELDAALAERS